VLEYNYGIMDYEMRSTIGVVGCFISFLLCSLKGIVVGSDWMGTRRSWHIVWEN